MLVKGSHIDKESVCDEWLFGLSSQEYLVMCNMLSPVPSVFQDVQAYNVTVPNMI